MKRFHLLVALLAFLFGIVTEWLCFPILQSDSQSDVWLGLKTIDYSGAFCLWFHSWTERLLGRFANPSSGSEDSYSPVFYIVASLQWALLFYLLFLVVHFFYRQTNPRILKLALAVTLILLLVTLHYKLHSDFSEYPRMKNDIESLAETAGGLRAEKDFDFGMLRKFVFSGSNSVDKFTGTNSGPYQIWISRYNPRPYEVSDFAIGWELYGYNQMMQKKYRTSLRQTNAPTAR